MALTIAAPAMVDVGPTGHSHARDEDRRIAHCAVVVDDDVGDVEQGVVTIHSSSCTAAAWARLTTAITWTPARLAPVATTLHTALPPEFDATMIASPGHEGELGQDVVTRGRQPLQPGAVGGADVQHQSVDEDRVDGGQPSRSVEELFGEDVRVTRAEHVDQSTTGDRPRAQVGRRADRGKLLGDDGVEHVHCVAEVPRRRKRRAPAAPPLITHSIAVRGTRWE